jgi:hypothetical protein
MANIDRALVAVGLAWLILGMLLGLEMGVSGNNRYLLVHVAMLLGGFVVLTLYGAIYRLWPALMQGTLPRTQFFCAVLGTVVTTVGAGMVVNQMGVTVALVGSLLEIIGAVLMAWLFWTRAAKSS